jgi:hypothetical protein
LLGAFVAWELRNPSPMLDVRLFRVRPFTVGSGTITLQFFALFGMFFMLTQYLQLAHGYSALKTAVSFLPLAACLMIGAPMSARLVKRFGPREVVGSGLLLTASGFVVLSLLRPASSYGLILLAEILIGLGMGQTTAPSTTLIMNSVRRANAGVGSAVNDTSRELGGALGVAVLGSILNSFYRGRILGHLPASTPRAVAAAAHGSVAAAIAAARPLPQDVARAVTLAAATTFTQAFNAACLVGAGMLVLASGMVWVFQDREPAPADQEVRHPEAEPAVAAG